MPRYDESPVPRGTSRRWEVILADEEDAGRNAPQMRALDVRAQHRILQDLSDDELARVPLLREGERLGRYKEYLDLHDPGRANFLAEGSEDVKPGQRIVAKASVPRDIWERLIEASHDVVGWRRRRSA
ncbi:MAG: hypothetical protein ACRDGT_11290 [Candidatus Limnocylindria bacterium]